MKMKLGRQPRIYDPRVPHMQAMLRLAPLAPPIPGSHNWADALPTDLGVMLNDQLGDCTCAGIYHSIQTWTANASPPIITAQDTDVQSLYEQACGYVPGDNSTDEGGVEQNVLSYVVNTGAPFGQNRIKISGFYEIDVRNQVGIQRGIYEAGVVYIGFNVPNWLMASGDIPQTWDTGEDTSIEGGHCVILTGYDPGGFNLVSWGQKFYMTWNFWQTYVDEAYALVSPMWIEKTGKTPLGLSVEDLDSEMAPLREE